MVFNLHAAINLHTVIKSASRGFLKSKNRTMCAKLKILHPQLSGLEHLSSEQRVVGSNPSGCTILSGGSRFLCVMEKNNLILQTKLLKSGTISTSRAGSSAGQSTSLLSLVSWVQVPPGSPIRNYFELITEILK